MIVTAPAGSQGLLRWMGAVTFQITYFFALNTQDYDIRFPVPVFSEEISGPAVVFFEKIIMIMLG